LGHVKDRPFLKQIGLIRLGDPMNQETGLCASILDALRDPALFIGPDTRLRALNAPMRALLPGARLGDPLARALRSPDILGAVDRVVSGSGREMALWREAVPVERVFDVLVSPLDLNPEERTAVITFRDLTDAHRLDRVRTDFIANVSHELRTPLASLVGFIDTLQGAARSDCGAREKFLLIMGEQAARMSRLIDDLLCLSRVEQHEHRRPETPTDLVATVGHVVDGLSELARQRRVKLALDATQQVIVLGDRDELLRLVENLVGNAIKYGAGPSDESVVNISVVRDNANARLRVRDHGQGIPREHLPRLTERFYRGCGESVGGTGLGLALVKHIVARHRGRLAVTSEPGVGSCFEVSLPLA
jgi:two-component system phosphate regulon sensor histidine kinase PhoR